MCAILTLIASENHSHFRKIIHIQGKRSVHHPYKHYKTEKKRQYLRLPPVTTPGMLSGLPEPEKV